jgi:hypothetical protein
MGKKNPANLFIGKSVYACGIPYFSPYPYGVPCRYRLYIVI